LIKEVVAWGKGGVAHEKKFQKGCYMFGMMGVVQFREGLKL